MGHANALSAADSAARGLLTRSAAIGWHLTANHYPPLPRVLIPVAERAIDLAIEAIESGDEIPDTPIDLPQGVEFRGRRTVTVSQAIETMHLDAFIESVIDEDRAAG